MYCCPFDPISRSFTCLSLLSLLSLLSSLAFVSSSWSWRPRRSVLPQAICPLHSFPLGKWEYSFRIGILSLSLGLPLWVDLIAAFWVRFQITPRQWVALLGAHSTGFSLLPTKPSSSSLLMCRRASRGNSGRARPWTLTPDVLDNAYFRVTGESVALLGLSLCLWRTTTLILGFHSKCPPLLATCTPWRLLWYVAYLFSCRGFAVCLTLGTLSRLTQL